MCHNLQGLGQLAFRLGPVFSSPWCDEGVMNLVTSTSRRCIGWGEYGLSGEWFEMVEFSCEELSSRGTRNSEVFQCGKGIWIHLA